EDGIRDLIVTGVQRVLFRSAIHFPQEAGIYKDEKGFNPCAVTIAPDGSIFVADGYGSNYVLKFDQDRKFVKAFGGPGEAEGKFRSEERRVGKEWRSGWKTVQ